MVHAAAAARAGLSGIRELPDFVFNDDATNEARALLGGPIAGVTDGFEGIGRLIRLSACAMSETSVIVAQRGINLRRTGLFMALPRLDFEGGDGDDEGAPSSPGALLPETVMHRSCEASALLVEPGHRYSFEGRSGFAVAVEKAIAALRRGHLDHCIVGACDSNLDPARIEAGIAAERVKSADTPAGYIPGEAAAFLLIERLKTTVNRGDTPEAILLDPCQAVEPRRLASDDPPVGEVMAQVLAASLRRADALSAPDGTLYIDMNGEPGRASDWGHAIARLRPSCSIHQWKQEYPAACFGDTGAAVSALSACLAARALSHGYARGPNAVIVLAEDEGPRAAIFVRAAPGS